MFRIDDHVGIAIAGLTSDARVLRYVCHKHTTQARATDCMALLSHLSVSCSNFMRQQAMGSKMVFNRPVPVNRLVSAIADSALPLPPIPPAKADARCFQRLRLIHRNTVGVRTASGSLSSGWTIPAHTCTSSRRVALPSSTSPSRSARAARVPRPTSRSTLSPLPTVRIVFLPFPSSSNLCVLLL